MREGHTGTHGHMNKHGMKDAVDQHPKSAQTFRRGRAIAFLEKLIVNRTTLQRQLKEPDLESIKQVISGELKATEAIIEEFIHIFQIYEIKDEESNENNESN